MDALARLAACDWAAFARDLDAQGWAVLPAILGEPERREAAALYERPAIFRKTVVMQAHAFGAGEYRYFAYPLPPVVQGLREGLWPRLAPIANAWRERLGLPGRFPAEHAAFLARCHAAGQKRPTPLMFTYGPGDYNRLHQDLYGEHVFPLQATILLDRPGADFEGGEFVLAEQRPRTQTRAYVVPLTAGDMVVFAVRERPERGARGDRRLTLRHGVSTIRSGRRRSLGIIFHDAA